MVKHVKPNSTASDTDITAKHALKLRQKKNTSIIYLYYKERRN